MAAVDILRRCNRIINLLKTHEYTITQVFEHLSDEFSYDRKTIERDLNALAGTNFITADDSVHPVVFKCTKEQRTNYLIRFQDPQIQVLLLALESFRKESPECISKIIIDIENSLAGSLPDNLRNSLLRFKDRGFSSYTIAGASNATNDSDIQCILMAVRERKRIKAVYNGRERELSPIVIKVVAGEFYLYAKDHGDDSIKWFKVCRFENASMLKTLAEINDDAGEATKSDHHHFGGFEGSEVIEYQLIGNQRLGDYFYERRIADDQDVEEMGEDKFKITFTQNDSYELIRLISSFGGNLYDISPASVKEQVKEVWQEGLSRLG